MKFLPCALLLLFVLSISIVGFTQEPTLQFRLYRFEKAIADPFQSRLAVGGDTAKEAVAMLPEFIKQRRGSLELELNAPLALDEPLQEVRSSDSQLEVLEDYPTVSVDYSTIDGLDIEYLTSQYEDGRMQTDVEAIFAHRNRGAAQILSARAETAIVPGKTSLLSRWEEGDDILLLLLGCDAPDLSAAGERPVEIIVDVSLYKSQADIAAGRSVARLSTQTLAGEQANAEMIVPFVYERADESLGSRDLGTIFESDPEILPDGSIEINMAIEHVEEGSGSEKDLDGNKIPRMDIFLLTEKIVVESGQPKMVFLGATSLLDERPVPSDWRAVVTAHVIGAAP